MKMIHMPTQNFGYKNGFGASGGRGVPGRHGHAVKAIVFHVFGGNFTKGTQNWFFTPGTAASYNDLILKNGDWIQLVEPFSPAWANGVVKNPSWDGFIRTPNGNIINPNLYTHAISREGHDTEMTAAQEQTLYFVARFRADQHCLPREKSSFIGHKDIDSVNRSYCPGRAFDWDKLYSALGLNGGFTDYTVVRGDSFWRIAQKHGITLAALVAANPHIPDPARIMPGQVLRIPNK